MAAVVLTMVWGWTCEHCETFLKTLQEDQIHYAADQHLQAAHPDSWVFRDAPRPTRMVWAFFMREPPETVAAPEIVGGR